MRSLLCLLAALAGAGCGSNIGDSCTQNIDCSPLGDRFCDTASPGGYCTIQDCSLTSCPDEAVCIRFFDQVASEPCDPTQAVTGCAVDERCLCDCGDDPSRPGYCLPAVETGSAGDGTLQVQCAIASGTPSPVVAHCAPESTERRWCMLRCSSDSDCRDGNYECRQTGAFGAEPVPDHTVSIGCDDASTSSDASCTPAIVAVGPADRFCVARSH